MHQFIDIANHLLASMVGINPGNLGYITGIKVFGVPAVFVLKFFGELFLLFLVSALISYIFKIDERARN